MNKPIALITNDDGYHSVGIQLLAEALRAGDVYDVWVVAPDTEKSAISSAITLWDPIRIIDRGPQEFSVTGTPTDCVFTALNRILPRKPDICVSGINRGANLGDDVIYSGTVAGAIEATAKGVQSVAVSLSSYRSTEFTVAAGFARRFTDAVMKNGLPRDVLLNVNVPPSALATTDIRVGKLGRRRYEQNVVEKADPRDKQYFWIGGKQLGHDDMPGSDCNLDASGFVTVTPVKIDMTDYKFAQQLRDWDLIEQGK